MHEHWHTLSYILQLAQSRCSIPKSTIIGTFSKSSRKFDLGKLTTDYHSEGMSLLTFREMQNV